MYLLSRCWFDGPPLRTPSFGSSWRRPWMTSGSRTDSARSSQAFGQPSTRARRRFETLTTTSARVATEAEPGGGVGAALDSESERRDASAMTLFGLLLLLAVAGLCGSLGSSLAGYSHMGCLTSIVLGFIGAWLGTWFASQVHLPPLYVLHLRGEAFPVVWSVIGAAMFSGVASMLTARNPHGF